MIVGVFGNLLKTDENSGRLKKIVQNLVENMNAGTFLFSVPYYADKSTRNYGICHEAVTELKSKYPDLKRVYVRSFGQRLQAKTLKLILNDYKDYDETIFPEVLWKIQEENIDIPKRTIRMLTKRTIVNLSDVIILENMHNQTQFVEYMEKNNKCIIKFQS